MLANKSIETEMAATLNDLIRSDRIRHDLVFKKSSKLNDMAIYLQN